MLLSPSPAPHPTIVPAAPRSPSAAKRVQLASDFVEELIEATDKAFCEDDAPAPMQSGVHPRAQPLAAKEARTRRASVVEAIDSGESAQHAELLLRRRFIGTAPTIVVIGPLPGQVPGRRASAPPVVVVEELDSADLVEGWSDG